MSAPLQTKTVTSTIKGKTVVSDRERFGATIGSQTRLHPHVTTFPGIKIGPEQVVPAGKVLKKDLM